MSSDRPTHNVVERCYRHLLASLAPLIVFYLAVGAQHNAQGLYAIANAIAPLYFTAILVLSACRIARASPEAVWSPAFWLPFQSAIFFGLGPLVEVYGNEATRLALWVDPLAVTPEQLFRSNSLSACGIGLLLGGFWLHTVLSSRIWVRSLNSSTATHVTVQPALLALGFILGGSILLYGIIKPAQWGMIDIVIPGGLTAIGSIVDVGFGIAAFAAARGNRSMRAVMVLAWPLHLFLAIISMTKLQIVTAMLLPAIGAYVGHKRLLRLAIYAVLIAAVFVPSQAYVSYGRSIIYANTGNISHATYGERVRILGQYIQEGSNNWSDGDSRQGWWTRLNYSGVQAYAMDAYDSGARGSTLNNVWMHFIPRVIWRDKPIMTGPSLEFYRTVTGNHGTSYLGLSIYGDLYWQFGWTGVILGCPLIGWMFAMVSWRSIAAMRSREFIYLPVVLIAIETAFLSPTEFLIGFIGRIPIYIVFLVAITMFARVARRNRYAIPLSSAPPATQRTP